MQRGLAGLSRDLPVSAGPVNQRSLGVGVGRRHQARRLPFGTVMTDRRIDPLRMSRLAEVEEEIAARIARLCSHFPLEDFRRLVSRMAEIDVRYRLRRDWLQTPVSDVAREPGS